MCQRQTELPTSVNRKKLVLRVRADAGFYDKDFVQFLDENKVGYVIVAKMTTPP